MNHEPLISYFALLFSYYFHLIPFLFLSFGSVAGNVKMFVRLSMRCGHDMSKFFALVE